MNRANAYVFFGRPTLYGAVAGGLAGVKKVIDIFRSEIELVMGQIGCPSLGELGPDFLWREIGCKTANPRQLPRPSEVCIGVESGCPDRRPREGAAPWPITVMVSDGLV